MLGVAVLMAPVVWLMKGMGRTTGIVFISLYAAYTAWLFIPAG